MGKVKILEDFSGKTAESLEPSAPAVVLGFEDLPLIGEEFFAGGAEGEDVALAPSTRLFGLFAPHDQVDGDTRTNDM